ncbi:plant expansin [Suillus subluteus]|nr:plant expansin [Suillus subluteus]
MRVTTILGFLSTVISFSFANTHGNHWGRRHQERSFDNARFTFYDVGLGACGDYSAPTDFIVALNVDQYGSGYPGPMCFLSITISYGGKTAQAVIMDECMGCPYGGLDFSTGLFEYFADESVGVLYGSWWFNSDTATTTTSWTPTTTSSWTPEPTTSTTPTTTWTPPTTSSTSTSSWTPPASSYTPTPTPTTTTSSTPTPTPTPSSNSPSSTPTPSSALPTTVNYSSGVGSGIAVPTGTAVAAPNSANPENLLVLNQAIIDIASMLVAAEDGI